jgi:uncharacterized protein YggE
MKQTITINWAWLGVYALLIAILGLNTYTFFNKNEEQRSITVEGTTTLQAEPDSFVFYPQFKIDEADPAKTKEALAAKSTDVIAKLKALGLADKDIELAANQYDNYPVPMKEAPEIAPVNSSQQTTISLTITTNDKALAQKVQDYLGTTDATGQLTPQSTFSEAQRQELTKQAEAKAIENAREKADALAKNLDTRRGKAITITPINNDFIGYPAMDSRGSETSASLPVQPGTDEFTYRVSVKFVLL